MQGVGNGANTSSIPIWQAETSKSHNRGLLICIEAAMIAVGTVISYWIDFGFAYVDSSAQWRFPIALQILFAFLLIGGIAVLPESPRWLLNRGRDSEALRVLAALNRTSELDPATRTEKKVIADSVAAIAGVESHSGFRDVFTGGKGQHLRRMLIGASSQMFQQLGGMSPAPADCAPPAKPRHCTTGQAATPSSTTARCCSSRAWA